MDFAHDIALLADCQKDAEELLQLVEYNALKERFGMNTEKTKEMIYNEPLSIVTKVIPDRYFLKTIFLRLLICIQFLCLNLPLMIFL